MKCPACFSELTASKLGNVSVDVCEGGCAGIWLDAFELQKVDEAHEVTADGLPEVHRDPGLEVDTSLRRACPRCEGIKLQRHFFSAKREIEVDHCPGCGGYWLDAGELDKIRQEKSVASDSGGSDGGRISVDTIRSIYRQKLRARPSVSA